MAQKDSNLIWLDLEMTGLNPERDAIIEIAVIATDSNLNIIAEGPEIALHQPSDVLDGMDEWCVKHHGESGLTERVQQSDISEAQAEQMVLDFVKQHVPAKKSPMCGNTIYQDRRFLIKHMPVLEAYFHYRLLDVSTVKMIAKAWAPKVYDGFKKKLAHRAMDDVRESIGELKHYRDTFFKLP